MKWRDRQGTARKLALLGGLLGVSFAVVGTGGDAHAQAIAGTTQAPLPNVLLLIDSSGSMERMTDNTLPSAAPGTNACNPGVQSNPNRWGMLVQAMTGNLQPYFSCDSVDRTKPTFKNEYRIGGSIQNMPYDADYYLPHSRPLSGNSAGTACAFAPSALPGAANGSGLGPNGLGAGGDPSDFPTNSFQPYYEQYLRAQYAANNGLTDTTQTCTFDQASDGQLDATRDYVRFGLMTFDNDPDKGIGVATYPLPNGIGVLSGPAPSPFLGEWSYLPSSSNPNAGTLGVGEPAGCATSSPFEVGARHWAAPPWEGRMVKFPAPEGTLFDIEATNDQIQQVIQGMRPYGATPVDGMMEDARDYLWYNTYGPNGTMAGYRDPYVALGGCRKQVIILLTDGAPNLDLRPSCVGIPPAQCPYPNKAAQVADAMAQATGSQHVETYVIGFSVNNGDTTRVFTNDGFPPAVVAPNNNCKAWFNQVTSNGSNLGAMHSICGTPATAPITGSTADACCQLSEIAYFGSPLHNVPPYFAESQADLVLSFGRVVGGITLAATTRTVPGYSPAVTISGQSVSADYIASFIPNAEKVWSGEIDRHRSICNGALPSQQTETVTAGDSYAADTASQAGARRFVSVQAADGATIDSLRTIRPYATGADGVPTSTQGGAQIVEASDMQLAGQAPWATALQINDSTCKKSRANDGTIIPALMQMDCLKVIWGFATATSSAISAMGYPNFNVRCPSGGASGASTGKCSISGASCTPLGSPCPTSGEVCVPSCSALGAIFRSSPQVVGPPSDLIRDDNYRLFASQRATRRPALFVATTDGVLHAFKALGSTWGGSVPAFDSSINQMELWSFVPPAVLPRLASNYPSGQQILLDGTPAIKDIIWDRTQRPEAPLYHTTLAAGLGQAGGGYYGLSVTDWDCQGPSSTGIGGNPTACLNAASISTPGSLPNLAQAATKGPQFLWQITDFVAAATGEVAKATHTSTDNKQFVALFGKQSGTPVLTTILADTDGHGVREIGVAILPGGIDGSPIPNQTCPRAINGGSIYPFPAGSFDQSDNLTALLPRGSVRRWTTDTSSTACTTGAVPGRNVTIVRADTGEIIKIFGRKGQDVPTQLTNLVIPSPFDSPMIGTPAVYPSGVGVTAQRVFVGDADGTVWRLDISSSNPALWKATLFQDLISPNLATGPGALQSEPIQIPLDVTQDPYGGIMVMAATGDQENIIANSTYNERNYLYSISEQPASLGVPGRAVVRWYQTFQNGARVTGPMTVFDRTLYFASYTPVIPNGNCAVAGSALLWGEDYFNAVGGNNANGTANSGGSGGVAEWCPIGSIDPNTGACAVAPVMQSEAAVDAGAPLGAIVPGVTVRATPSCATFSTGTDPAVTGFSQTTYSLFFGATASASSSTTGSPQAARPAGPGVTRPLPRSPARIDSWAFVVD